MDKEFREALKSAIDEAKGNKVVIECEKDGISIKGSIPSFIVLMAAGQIIGDIMTEPESWDVNMIADFVRAGIVMSYNDVEIGSAYTMVFADALKRAANKDMGASDD